MLYLITLTLSGLVLIFGQGSLPASVIRPNLTLIIIIYAGQFYPPIPGLFISFFLGYFLDMVSGGLSGLNAFSMVSVCYLSFILSKKMVIQNRLTQVLAVFSFYLIYGGIIYLLFRFFNFHVTGYTHLRTILLDGIAAAILSLLVISAIKKMERFFRFENKRTAPDLKSGDIKR